MSLDLKYISTEVYFLLNILLIIAIGFVVRIILQLNVKYRLDYLNKNHIENTKLIQFRCEIKNSKGTKK